MPCPKRKCTPSIIMLVKSSGLMTKFAMMKPKEAVRTKPTKMYVRMLLSSLMLMISL